MPGVISRVQPRILAPVLLGVGNIASGVGGLVTDNSHVPSYVHLVDIMPLSYWWWSYIILGVLILSGPLSTKLAYFTAVLAVTWWMFSAALIEQTLGSQQVSIRQVIQPCWLAILHILLAPYFRRAPCTDGD